MTHSPARTTTTAGSALAALVAVAGLAGCGSATMTTPATSPPTPTASTPTPPTPTASSSAVPTPPAWLGTRVLPTNSDGSVPAQQTPKELQNRAFTLPDTVEALPGSGWDAKVVSPAPAEVIARSTWQSACPVKATDLAWIRLAFWGFDDTRHTGELLVAGTESAHIVQAFKELWQARFPIEEMRVTTQAEQTAAPTGDGNNTTAFNCRVVRGSSSWSEHAYGLAVDVNPFQNPYSKGNGASMVVLPELARAYLDRDDVRPGMILAGSAAVKAFADVGWGWGGAWRTLSDRQHFSARDR